jgi:hypothetical protein
MKYAIFGDIHGNLEAFQAVLGHAVQQGCTDHVCVGDIVGYGANPRECLDLVRQMGCPVVKGNHDDILIVLSGSGNSLNVVKALEMGNSLGMKTFAILGFTGGMCKAIAKYPIHFEIDDMQISEDLQLIVGHMCMQWLCDNPAV